MADTYLSVKIARWW